MPTARTAAILATALALGGCAPTVYYKDGATQADFNTDSYQCERDVRQGGYYGYGIGGAIEMQKFYGRCMGAKGYYPREKNTTSAPPSATPGATAAASARSHAIVTPGALAGAMASGRAK